MATYYVRNGGSDSADGLSDGNAWATISRVNSGTTFTPGDSILFKRGSTWRGEQLNIPGSGSSGSPITYGAYDSGANPVISGAALKTSFTVEGSLWYTAASPAPLQVFYDGSRLTLAANKGATTTGKWWWDSANSRVYIADTPSGHTVEASSVGAPIYISSRNWLVFDGLTISMAISQGCGVYGGATASANNVWQNCTFSNCYYQGIKFWSAGPAQQTNNIIQDCEVCYNGGSGIQFQNNTPDAIIRRNYVHHNCYIESGDSDHLYTAGIKINAGEGVIIEENYVYSNGFAYADADYNSGCGIWLDSYPEHDPFDPCIVRYNRVKDDFYNGIRVEITHDAKVYGNVISGTSGHPEAAGICLMGHQDIGDGATCEDNLFYNNTVYGCNPYGIYLLSDTTSVLLSRNIFKNNISSGNVGRELCAIYGGDNTSGQGTGNTYWYNCFGAQATNFIQYGGSTSYSTYAAWEADSKVIKDGGTTHSVQADPTFTDADSDDFTLQETSPCIDAGFDLGATYQAELGPTSTWPSGVVLLDEETHGVV